MTEQEAREVVQRMKAARTRKAAQTRLIKLAMQTTWDRFTPAAKDVYTARLKELEA